MTNQKKKNQRTIIILALMTMIPFSVAWYLTTDSNFRPKSTNNGDLIVPLITTERTQLAGVDPFSVKNIDELRGHWVLLNIIPSEACHQVCAQAIRATKQIRLMINKDLTRTRRAVIIMSGVKQQEYALWKQQGDIVLEKDFQRLEKEEIKILQESHEKTLKLPWWNQDYRLLKLKPDTVLAEKIKKQLGQANINGQLILMDPLGNLMMQYKTGFDPYDVKSDLKKLLRNSQIG